MICGEGHEGTLTIYDVVTGQERRPPISLPEKPQSVAARPNHGDVAALCVNGQMVVINLDDPSRRLDIIDEHRSQGQEHLRLTYSPDGKQLVYITGTNEISVHDPDNGQARYAAMKPVLTKHGNCRAMAISPDGRWLGTAVIGISSLQVWDLQTGDPACKPLIHPGDAFGIFGIAFSPDGRWILSANKDGGARLWDWRTEKLVCPPLQHPDEVYDVAFVRDGLHAVTAVRNGGVHVWELTTGKQISPPVLNPFFRYQWTNTLTVTGDLVIAGSDHNPIHRLTSLLDEAVSPSESLLPLAELATARRLQLGELNSLSQQEWQQLWEMWKATRGKSN